MGLVRGAAEPASAPSALRPHPCRFSECAQDSDGTGAGNAEVGEHAVEARGGDRVVVVAPIGPDRRVLLPTAALRRSNAAD